MIEAHICRIREGRIEFLILKRSDDQIYPGLWQMVTGKIDEGEKAYRAAAREIEEETGIKTEKMYAAPNVNSFYNERKDRISLIPVFCIIVPEDTYVQISEEHSEYKWTSPEEAKKLFAWPGQRRSVDAVVEFIDSEESVLHFAEIDLK